MADVPEIIMEFIRDYAPSIDPQSHCAGKEYRCLRISIDLSLEYTFKSWLVKVHRCQSPKQRIN